MTLYTGFDPGTYQPWALNLTQQTLGQPGIAHGFKVQPVTPASMNVQLTLDAVSGDAVLFLGNGGWCRIDQVVTLAVPSNTTGTNRTDAVLFQMDPTGETSSQFYYAPNWTTGFAPQSYAGSTQNCFVLAVVTVPNNATSITTSNIVQTPLVASSGTAPQNYPDGVIGSEQVDANGSQPGVFVAINTLITAAALNGQTTFSIPLTTMQRLVPQGRIGGALELGDFAGPNGWYWPKVQGSVSGLLPVANVDPVGGSIITATAAATGETITVSYKYYDFSRDAKVRAGAMYTTRNSPYLVYQGEVIEDSYGKSMPLWEGTQGAYLLRNPGESYYYIDYSTVVELAQFGGPGGSTNTMSILLDGVTYLGNATPSALGAPPGQTYRYEWVAVTPATGYQPHVYQVKLTKGTLLCPGVRNYLSAGLGVFVSGGLVNVQGQDVLLASTSFALPASLGAHQSYTIYTDRYGNISSGLSAPAGMERIAGRVPLAAAAQFGGQTATSASYGLWTLPNTYLGLPVETAFLGNYTASSPTYTTNGDGWTLVADPLSPNGAYVVSYSSADIFAATAVCTGMDLLLTTSNNTAVLYLWVDQPNINAAARTVYLAAGSQHNVRLTAFSGLGLATHTLKVFNATSSSLLGFDSLDIRVPATPAPPTGTLSLAQVDTFGYSASIRPPLTIGVATGNGGNASYAILDATRVDASPAIWLTNISDANYQFIGYAANTGNYTLHYQTGPDKGFISLPGGNFADCYATAFSADVLATLPEVNTFSISSSGVKNGSSLSTVIVVNAIEYTPYQNFVTDLRHYGVGRGHASELRGSTLLSHQGARFDDGAVGVRTEHLLDRSVSSRKLAPGWASAVTTTNWSGAPGVDPYLSTTIVVEVPSALLVTFGGTPIVMPNAEASLRLVVDGIIYATPRLTSSGAASGGIFSSMSATTTIPVPAGTHLLQLYLDNANVGAQPYYGSTSVCSRYLNVVAFAL